MGLFNLRKRATVVDTPARPGGGKKWMLYGAGLLFGYWVLKGLTPFAVVETGQRGVLTTWGNPSEQVYEPGLHFVLPMVQKMNLMDVQIQMDKGEGQAASKDLQSVRTQVAINYHLDPDYVVQAFKTIGKSTPIIAGRIIEPAASESVKAVTSQFTAEELVTRRTEVRDAIAGLLREKIKRHGLVLDEFNIINFAFSASFSEAIENKVKAEQMKLQADRDLERIRVEAEQKVVSAKAEAQALASQRMEITSELLKLRQIENERVAIEKWDGKLPTVTGGSVPFVNLSK